MSQKLITELPCETYHRDLISCQQACPVYTDARGYVRMIAEGRFDEAYLLARGPNPFASICGRVCAAPCESACRRGRIPLMDEHGRWLGINDRPIAIRALKRAACERAGMEVQPAEELLEAMRQHIPTVSAHTEEMAALLSAFAGGTIEKAKGERVAIVGAGPAGLSAAHDLALMGFSPVVFESEPSAAGMLLWGVPAYRLPRELIEWEIEVIKALGVEIRCNTIVGKDISLRTLRREYAAVILAMGAKSSRSLGLSGERGPRVYGGVDFLRSVGLGRPLDIGQRVVVIGGGNVAYDVGRTVIRQTSYDTARSVARLTTTKQVSLVSLEDVEEMPADTIEIVEGDEEGIIRHNGWGPVEIRRDNSGQVISIILKRCLQVYDEKRQFKPIFDDKDLRELTCDTVLLAVGQSTDLSLLEEGGADIQQFRQGWPKVDPRTLASTGQGVFVAGDLAHGTKLIIDAVASGKLAARSVYTHITGRSLEANTMQAHIVLADFQREKGYEHIRRLEVPTAHADTRLKALHAQVELGYGEQQAIREASRCLDCGVTPVFDGTRCILCGGCVDVCPTLCLKIVSLDQLVQSDSLQTAIETSLGIDIEAAQNSAILKDEDRCIRCALCVKRCPADAIYMERVAFQSRWNQL